MALRHVVLGLLVDHPDHAYAIKHRLSPGVPREQLINDGVLYPLLAKLESDGLAESTELAGSKGRPRRVYTATRAGRAEFRRWLRSPDDEEGPPMYELFTGHPLVKLLFAGHLSPAELREKLESHSARVGERIAALEALPATSAGAADGLGPALLDLELRQLRERREWLGERLEAGGGQRRLAKNRRRASPHSSASTPGSIDGR
jgi:DNA-binding PadR family transcriptional regulator